MHIIKPLFCAAFLIASCSCLAQDWQAPRMDWGDPDLQGVWTNATVTGLERLPGFDSLVISEAQARRLEQRDAENSDEIDNLPDGDLPSGEIVGGYNTAWLDRGTHLLRVKGEPQTSIIVEPANGKVPYTISGWRK